MEILGKKPLISEEKNLITLSGGLHYTKSLLLFKHEFIYESGIYIPHEYRNAVIVKPDSQDSISLFTVSEITCLGSYGIINKAITGLLYAMIFLALGILTIRYNHILVDLGDRMHITKPINTLRDKLRRRRQRKEATFEEKVLESFEEEE